MPFARAIEAATPDASDAVAEAARRTTASENVARTPRRPRDARRAAPIARGRGCEAR